MATASAVAAVSRASKAPRSNSTETIGPPITMSAAAQGIVSARAISAARDPACRAPSASPAFSRAERSGSSTTPTAIPTTPRGSW